MKHIQGESFQFYMGDLTAKSWYEGDHHEWMLEIPFILDHMLSPTDIVFEVGSHHGFHLIPIARRVSRAIAIEPNPHNVAILKKNLALNSLNNVTVVQAAIGDSVGRISILQDTNEGGVSSSGMNDLPTISVDLLPLDQLAEQFGFPQFLKIDVEGFENRVLKGASQIMRYRPKIAIEVHVDWIARYGSSVEELLGLLRLDDYKVWILSWPPVRVTQWGGEDLRTYPPPKFHLYLLPHANRIEVDSKGCRTFAVLE
jgi:FkbM family methyltransferase